MESPEKVIYRWESTSAKDYHGKMIFESDPYEIQVYLNAVDELQRCMDGVSISDRSSVTSSALEIAMSRLEDEFRNILLSFTSPIEFNSLLDSTYSSSLTSRTDSLDYSSHSQFREDADSGSFNRSEFSGSRSSSSSSVFPSSSSIREVDLIPKDAIFDLRCIAERLIAAGYLRECIRVYASVRNSAIDASFKTLGIEKFSLGDVQSLPWETVEQKIRRWIRAARICIRVLFASEKRLCQQIFEGADDLCFTETIKGPANQLFIFAEAISVGRRDPEKLFKTIDLHDALSDLLPDIAEVFSSKSTQSIRVKFSEIISRLTEAVRGILTEFENAVLHESSQTQIPEGTVHPLTRYVMNYITLISDYRKILMKLIVSKPSTGSRYSTDPNIPDVDFSEFEGQNSSLACHLIWIIVILQFNLDGKSKIYKDSSLTHLFMMNNVHYIVQKIKGSSELRLMIGDHYLKVLTGKYRVSATSYERSSLVRVLYCLRDEGLHVNGGVSKSAIRDRFKSFNHMFEEMHRTQATWLVPDIQLREELRISISSKLIPAYSSFLGRFRSHIESGRHPENYIKYSVEDLEVIILDFFEGNHVFHHLRKRSHFKGHLKG